MVFSWARVSELSSVITFFTGRTAVIGSGITRRGLRRAAAMSTFSTGLASDASSEPGCHMQLERSGQPLAPGKRHFLWKSPNSAFGDRLLDCLHQRSTQRRSWAGNWGVVGRKTGNVSLTRQLEAFINGRIAQYRLRSASGVVRAALRLWLRGHATDESWRHCHHCLAGRSRSKFPDRGILSHTNWRVPQKLGNAIAVSLKC